MKRALPLSYTQKKTLGISFQFGLNFNSANFQKQPEPDCRSTDPRYRSTMPVDRASPRVRHFQSVDRYNLVHVGAQRSTGPVDRAAAAAASQRSTGPVDRDAAAVATSLLLLLLNLWIIVDFLDFLSSSYTFPWQLLPLQARHP